MDEVITVDDDDEDADEGLPCVDGLLCDGTSPLPMCSELPCE